MHSHAKTRGDNCTLLSTFIHDEPPPLSTQYSIDGHTRLGKISCRDDAYLRTLLIRGAHSSLQRAKAVAMGKSTSEQIRIRQIASRLPFGKVPVAIANKHARQVWAMLAHDEIYDAEAWLKHSIVQRPAGKQAASRIAMA